jgi:hypothetical protein
MVLRVEAKGFSLDAVDEKVHERDERQDVREAVLGRHIAS